MNSIFEKRDEVMITFNEDEKNLGYSITHFFPVEILKTKPATTSKLYERIVERTGDKKLAAYVESWAKVAAVGETFKNEHIEACVYHQ